MQLRDLLKYGNDVLREAGIEGYGNDAKLLLMYVLGIDYTDVFMKMYDEVAHEDAEFYKDVISVRASHYPCQYIVGTQDFMGYTFKVEEEVLIPRPETEILVESALECTGHLTKCRALDMCTGTGCIGISYYLKRREAGFKGDEIALCDISEKAVRLAAENVFNLSAKCDIIESDLFERIDSRYDLIMSNPPYIPTSDIDEIMEDVREYEPRLALDGMEDGLYFYKKIIKECDKYLYSDGCLIFEIGYDQYEDIRGLLTEAGFSQISVRQDYAGLDRVVIAKR